MNNYIYKIACIISTASKRQIPIEVIAQFILPHLNDSFYTTIKQHKLVCLDILESSELNKSNYERRLEGEYVDRWLEFIMDNSNSFSFYNKKKLDDELCDKFLVCARFCKKCGNYIEFRNKPKALSEYLINLNKSLRYDFMHYNTPENIGKPHSKNIFCNCKNDDIIIDVVAKRSLFIPYYPIFEITRYNDSPLYYYRFHKPRLLYITTKEVYYPIEDELIPSNVVSEDYEFTEFTDFNQRIDYSIYFEHHFLNDVFLEEYNEEYDTWIQVDYHEDNYYECFCNYYYDDDGYDAYYDMLPRRKR
jgi:hypothetical protein